MNAIGNVFESTPDRDAAEQFVELLSHAHLRIERIVSNGHATPDGYWYDQPQAEWVLLLSGEAKLLFEDEATARAMLPGDFVDIAPHRRHRIEWTHPEHATIWLAVHYTRPSNNASA